MSAQSHAAYGSAKVGMPLIGNKGNPYLPNCLAWRPFVCTWQNLTRQHDAGEYLQHVLQLAKPQAYHGTWESRLTNPHTIADSGYLTAPVRLHLGGPTLQSLITMWHQQYAVHAVSHHSGLVVLQLCRYSSSGAKDCSVLPIVPGERLRLPVFVSAEGTHTSEETFCVIWVVFHVGETTRSGHYQAALSVPNASAPPSENTAWDYYVCNDGKTPRKARKTDHTVIAANAYLVGLLRCD